MQDKKRKKKNENRWEVNTIVLFTPFWQLRENMLHMSKAEAFINSIKKSSEILCFRDIES